MNKKYFKTGIYLFWQINYTIKMDTLHSPIHQTHLKSLPLKFTHSNSKLSFPDQSTINSSMHALKANSNVLHMKRVPFS